MQPPFSIQWSTGGRPLKYMEFPRPGRAPAIALGYPFGSCLELTRELDRRVNVRCVIQSSSASPTTPERRFRDVNARAVEKPGFVTDVINRTIGSRGTL